MSIFAEFFKHANFGGHTESFTLTNNWRYYWIKFGSTLRNEITSFRANAYSGTGGNVYGFASRNFLGEYAALDMSPGWTCWWSNVGSAMNDDIESALLINRSQSELVLPLRDQIADPFIEAFDEETKGTQVSRRGGPKVYSVYWPSFSPNRKFVRIEQDLRVALDWWPDYDARVRFDVYLYLSNGQVNGYVDWVHTWVEGGIFSGDILDELHPKMLNGASELTSQIQDQLALLNLFAVLGGYSFQRLYLLPGNEPEMPPPSAEFGHMGTATENSTLALTY